MASHPWWESFWTVMVVLMTLPEAYGEYAQGKTVWNARQAEKLPLDSYTIDVGTFLATFLYGVTLGSWAYMFNGIVTGGALLYVLVGVVRFGERSRAQVVHAGVVVAAVLCMLGATGIFLMTAHSSAKRVVMFAMSLFLLHTIVSEVQKLRALFRGEGTGQVNIRANNTWLIANMIFVFYAVGIRDPIFLVCCICCMLIQAAFLWIYCRKRQVTVYQFICSALRHMR